MIDYKLYYWPIPFRGHFIRYVLAHVGATWEEATFEEVAALKSMAPEVQGYPFMAPPLLEVYDTETPMNRPAGANVRLSQMPAIVMYLARKHGVKHDPDRDLRLICDASDILFEITRYHGALMWDAESWAGFVGDRLPRWMAVHERVVQGCTVGFLGQSKPALGDLVLAALWHTMIDRLPPLRAVLHDHAPILEGLVDRVAAEPEIAAMLDEWRDREPRYCAGQIEASLLNVLEMET